MYTSPSRFLSDIDAQYLDLPNDFKLSNSVDNTDFDFQKFRQNGFSHYGSNNQFGFNSQNRPSYTSSRDASHFAGNAYDRDASQSITKPTNLKKIQTAPAATSSNTVDCAGDLKTGTNVKHERFGIGVITAIETMNSDYKLTIQFENIGEKKILLKYAKLEII